MASFFQRFALFCGVMPVVVSGGMAFAGDHPRLTPARDVAVTYRVEAPGMKPGQGQVVKVSFSGSGDRLRIDASDGRGITILDRPAKTVTLVMIPRKSYLQIHPQHGLHNPFMLDVGMTYQKVGSDKIAGVSCERWNIQTDHGKATACVTEDGVILSERGVDADGVQGAITAEAVTYGDLPASSFEPPAGFEDVRAHVQAGPRGAQQGRNPTTSMTPPPVPEGAGAGEAVVPPVGGMRAHAPESGQPSVSNDSSGDGTVSTPDQPPSGPGNGG